jgi:hypothetical protein
MLIFGFKPVEKLFDILISPFKFLFEVFLLGLIE